MIMGGVVLWWEEEGRKIRAEVRWERIPRQILKRGEEGVEEGVEDRVARHWERRYGR